MPAAAEVAGRQPDEAIRRALDERVLSAVRPATVSFLVMFAAMTFLDVLQTSSQYGMLLRGKDLIVVTTGLVVMVQGYRNAIPAAWANAVVGGLGLMTAVGTLVSFAALGTAAHLTMLALVLFAVANVVLSTRWLATLGLTVGLGSILLLWFRRSSAEIGLDTLVLILSVALAVRVQMARERSLRRLERLRAIDQGIHHQLERALTSLRRELDDRKRAEAEREGLRRQLVQAQKMEAIGTLAGGIAHDMNNVLGAISGFAEMVWEGLETSDPLRSDAEQIVLAARRGSELTRNLLGFSRKGKYRRERVRLDEVVAEVESLLVRTLPKGITIRTAFAHDERGVEGDPGQLSHALMNLCLNASDAMAGKGVLTIRTSLIELDDARAPALQVAPGTYVQLEVTDTGRGMDEHVKRRMFEPFFTTKETGKGTGLGLAMVYGAVQNHGGAIEVDSELHHGTTVRVILPSLGDGSGGRISLARERVGAGLGGLVLLVDDEPMVRSLGQRFLERLGYTALLAQHGAEAVALYEQRRTEVALVVLDMSMPVMDGVECFDRLLRVDPQVRVLLTSGYARGRDTELLLTRGALGFLDKPYTLEAFAEAVARGTRGERYGGRPLRSESPRD